MHAGSPHPSSHRKKALRSNLSEPSGGNTGTIQCWQTPRPHGVEEIPIEPVGRQWQPRFQMGYSYIILSRNPPVKQSDALPQGQENNPNLG